MSSETLPGLLSADFTESFSNRPVECLPALIGADLAIFQRAGMPVMAREPPGQEGSQGPPKAKKTHPR